MVFYFRLPCRSPPVPPSPLYSSRRFLFSPAVQPSVRPSVRHTLSSQKKKKMATNRKRESCQELLPLLRLPLPCCSPAYWSARGDGGEGEVGGGSVTAALDSQLLPSNRRYRVPKVRLDRLRNSFIPQSIKILHKC